MFYTENEDENEDEDDDWKFTESVGKNVTTISIPILIFNFIERSFDSTAIFFQRNCTRFKL